MINNNQAVIQKIPTSRIQIWVYAFILLHIFLWTLAPALVRYTLPMDAIEGAIWGHQLEWGYDKHPFLNGWLIALALKLDGHTAWGIYLFSQLSVALCFWAVWEFGKKILPPLYAFILVLILESMQYYNLHAIDFNNNTLQPGFWAATVLFFYQALEKNKLRDWILTGIFAALSMLTKYYAVMLLIPMFAFMLLYPNTRAQFKKINVYLGVLTFVIILAPHIIWLFSHDFSTFNYAMHRVTVPPSWFNHIFYPAQFTWQQIEVFLPALLIVSTLFIGKTKKDEAIEQAVTLTHYDKIFLLFIGIGPILLTVLASAFAGWKLRAGWGQPLLTYWGFILIVWLMPMITLTRLKRFVIASLTLMIGTVMGYCITLMLAKDPSSANYPGKNIALTLSDEWHRKYGTVLSYVVGPRELSGNIAFHSTDHPSVYIDAKKQISPWIDENKLKQKGAIFVWDSKEKYEMPYEKLKERFPNLEPRRLLCFSWMRNRSMSPVVISVAYLPPEHV